MAFAQVSVTLGEPDASRCLFAVAGRSYLIRNPGGGATAALFADQAATIALPNPITVNGGDLTFWIAEGTYERVDNSTGVIRALYVPGPTASLAAHSTDAAAHPDIRAMLPTGVGVASGLKLHRATYGTEDQATVLSLIADRESDPGTEVDRTTDPSVAQAGHVVLNNMILARPPVAEAATLTLFTATTVQASAWTGSIGSVRANMLIQAGASGPFAFVVSVAGNVVTHGGWRANQAAAATPAAGTAVVIDKPRKIWNVNQNIVILGGAQYAGLSAASAELGFLIDSDTAGSGLGFGTVHRWGIDVNTLNSVGSITAAYVARGRMGYCYSAGAGPLTVNAFVFHKQLPEWDGTHQTPAAFKDDQSMSLVSFLAERDNTAGHAFVARRPGDTQPRWAIGWDPTVGFAMGFGPGGALGTDTDLFRAAAGFMRTSGNLQASQGVYSRAAQTDQILLTGNAGVPLIALGLALDTFISRAGTSRVGVPSLDVTGDLRHASGNVGFYGHAPVAQQAHAVTLADVINVLANVGLTL